MPGVLSVPLSHFPGSEGQGNLLSSLTPITPAPEKSSVPPSLVHSHHLDTSAPCRSLRASCMLPASGCPTQAWPSQQALFCELPSPTMHGLPATLISRPSLAPSVLSFHPQQVLSL